MTDVQQQTLPVGTGRKTPRFTQWDHDAFRAYCDELGVANGDRAALLELAQDADWKSGIVRGFSLLAYAERLGYGSGNGRRTLRRRLDRLVAVGAVTYSAPAGGSKSAWRAGQPRTDRGQVVIVDYDRFIKRDLSKAFRVPSKGVNARSGSSDRGVSTRDQAPVTEVSTRDQAPVTEVSTRDQAPVTGLESASEQERSPLEDVKPMTTVDDSLPTLSTEPEVDELAPGRERPIISGPAKALLEAARADGRSVFGTPARDLVELVEENPDLVSSMVAAVRGMHAIRTTVELVAALRLQVEDLRRLARRQVEGSRVEAAELRRRSACRDAADFARSLAITLRSQHQVDEDLADRYSEDLELLGLARAEVSRIRQPEVAAAAFADLRSALAGA